ncbi:MAG: hypothetical protein K6A94_06365 [Bacteroidales bacterium]|nr:hypothetical protein [Bacteroidales bacterium]
MKKQIFLLTLLLSVAASAFAVEEVEIGGLWYEVVSKNKMPIRQKSLRRTSRPSWGWMEQYQKLRNVPPPPSLSWTVN